MIGDLIGSTRFLNSELRIVSDKLWGTWASIHSFGRVAFHVRVDYVNLGAVLSPRRFASLGSSMAAL